MHRIRVVVCDWDGVISQTDPANEWAFRVVLGSRGLPMEGNWYREFFLGRTLKEALPRYLLAIGESVARVEELETAKRSLDEACRRMIEPYADAIDFLGRVKGRRILAVATGARPIQIKAGIEKFDLDGTFAVVVTAHDYTYGKPNPEPYMTALRKLNNGREVEIRPEECLVVEDSPMGVKAAKAAGMICAAVTHTHSREELLAAGADLVVDDLRDLATILVEGSGL